jgi:hypothetical protein
MSMITDRMIGEYHGYNMYANDSGMYYFSELVNGYFITKAFDNIESMKSYIDEITA